MKNMLRDLLKETMWSLAGNKVRSGLTILGIVIGIASVITMVSVGQGAKDSIEDSIQSIGSNLIVVFPGAQRGGMVSAGRGTAQTLTLEDSHAVKERVKKIKAIAPEVSGRYQITAKGANTNTQVTGTEPDYLAARNIELDYGSFITEQQIKKSAKVAVLGPSARDDLFGEGVSPIGQTVRIKNVEFVVIGVTKAKGGSGFTNPDDVVYVPISSAQHFLSGNEYVSAISIAADSQDSMTAIQNQIKELLLKRHGILESSEADFNLINQTDIISAASSVTDTFTVLLASIAGISLLVGGIGIMNMMLTTVTERTREIGLRKAVGVRKIYINFQFLAEAVMLTFFGGNVGIVLGVVAAQLITEFTGLATSISPSSIVMAFGVSAAVGIVFGFYPARRAANLSPIEALRYE